MTNLTELREVVLMTEWTLPQPGLLAPHWVGLIQLLPVGLLGGKASHAAHHQLACRYDMTHE